MAEPSYYQIRVEGHLSPQWGDWLGGMTITHEANGETLLAGWLPDQAALHGILDQIRDLGLALIALNRSEPQK
jgi:hypothetical protein